MKQLISSKTITIPDGVTVEVKARKVRVKGPRGEFGYRNVGEAIWVGLREVEECARVQMCGKQP